jgi:hypothetical protein
VFAVNWPLQNATRIVTTGESDNGQLKRIPSTIRSEFYFWSVLVDGGAYEFASFRQKEAEMSTSSIAAVRGLARASILKALIGGFVSVAPLSAFADCVNNPNCSYVFSQVDYPGAVDTDVFGLNNTGSLVGIATLDGSNYFGFLASPHTGGSFSFSTLPAAADGATAPFAINDSGTIVGELDTPSTTYGFVLDPPYAGVSSYEVPYLSDSPFTITVARGINDSGVIAGYAPTPTPVGFVYDRGVFTNFSVPGATYFLIVHGINNVGQVAGEGYLGPGLGTQAFIRDPASGLLTYFSVPGGRCASFPCQKTQTRAVGINNLGVIAGYTESGGAWTPYVMNPSMTDSELLPTTLFDPTQTDSYVLGFNDSGVIAGHTTAEDGSDHGFIITPNYVTGTGTGVSVNVGDVGPVTVDLTFQTVTSAGLTSVVQIDPSLAGSLPSGYSLSGAGLAFEITTTATYTTPPPIIIAFAVPSVDPSTFAALRILHNEGGVLVDRTASVPAPDPTTQTIYASVPSLSPFVIAKATLRAAVQQPINPDGSSVFSAQRGVVPVKFSLAAAGVATCELPAATISLTRIAGSVLGAIDEGTYLSASDSGSSFRISGCQYLYNLSASQLGAGTYRVDVLIGGASVGSGVFALK